MATPLPPWAAKYCKPGVTREDVARAAWKNVFERQRQEALAAEQESLESEPQLPEQTREQYRERVQLNLIRKSKALATQRLERQRTRQPWMLQEPPQKHELDKEDHQASIKKQKIDHASRGNVQEDIEMFDEALSSDEEPTEDDLMFMNDGPKATAVQPSSHELRQGDTGSEYRQLNGVSDNQSDNTETSIEDDSDSDDSSNDDSEEEGKLGEGKKNEE